MVERTSLTFEAFQAGKPETWPLYLQRLEFHFEAHGIATPKMKRAVFCSVCGAETYAILHSLCAPTTPSETDYADIIKKLGNHFAPKPSEIVERFKFHKRAQHSDEPMAAFIADLRRIAVTCNFGDALDSSLRDQIVCGVKDEALQRRLLSEAELTLAQAEKLAIAAECAKNNAMEIRTTPKDVSQIHSVAKDGPGPSPPAQHHAKPETKQATSVCYRCNGAHSPQDCHFKNATCLFCGRKGHIVKACLQKKAKKSPPRARRGTAQADLLDGDTSKMYELYNLSSNEPAILVDVDIDGQPTAMEVDSGCMFSVISRRTMARLHIPNQRLKPSTVALRTYTKEPVIVLGRVLVEVKHKERSATLPLLVVKGEYASLLGRNWFKHLGIGLTGVHQLRNTQEGSGFLEEFKEIFDAGLGKSRGPPIRVEVDRSAAPKFCKSRQVPYAMRPKVEQELEKLVQQGILEPVKHSNWATPIVPILKKSGELRICGDYKSTVNKAVKWECYPLPTPEQLLSNLAGCRRFTQLDLAQAYQQLTVDDESAKLFTITTHKGLFKVNRLPFGVSVAVAIFQRYMEELLAGIEGVLIFLDDILIGGESKEQHDRRLRAVLQRFKEDGLRLNKAKCTFNTMQVVFLGFRIDKDGVRPTEDKVKAIHEAPEPKNKQELQSFLGLLNFYHRFLKGAAHTLEPLYRLLDKGASWTWTVLEAEAYRKAKELLKSTAVLAHYDTSKPLLLTCDASPYGLGAVLSHVADSGQESPIAYGSRTLSKAERNYSQTDREALAIIYGVKKFHQYIYGRPVTIITDHKPLLGLLSPHKEIPAMVSPRVLRWSLMLAAYHYDLQYRPGSKIGNADALSRLPIPATELDDIPVADVWMLETAPEQPWNSEKIAASTRKDSVLARVQRWIMHGWPDDKQHEQFKPYTTRKDELSTYKGCIIWGSRLVIPKVAQSTVLDILHTAHPGIVRMKALARSTVWWPGIDHDIEEKAANCSTCQEHRPSMPRAPVHPWETTQHPWSRLHVDFAGPFKGKIFLIVVDSFSKWLDVCIMNSMSSSAVVQKLRMLFAVHGVPDVIVSDNGTAFVSAEFKEFTSRNQIRHVAVAPYHPSSNGQAERMVRETKEALTHINSGDVNVDLARFLFRQHTLPHSLTGRSPAELLMNRRLKTALDRLHPDSQFHSSWKQEDKFLQEGKKARLFTVGENVYARNYLSGAKWTPGVVTAVTGPLSYRIETEDGRSWRRHVDQLRRKPATTSAGNSEDNSSVDLSLTALPEAVSEEADVRSDATPAVQPAGSTTVSPSNSSRPQRATRRPTYLNDYVP
ncbi:uncharacterized protein K02A2.6-like [Ixodes scapularis]|uniref:uncharacterized protein K02A2.6-like n=1 Tax=Ixodes scapularis TaxID=6945 RepID=UPI001C395BEA|nr:uncharacterized protein K02A2.6-like [Ixodes scapularis]